MPRRRCRDLVLALLATGALATAAAAAATSGAATSPPHGPKEAAATAAVATAPPLPAPAGPVTLRSQVTVAGEVIRLGDLFDTGAGAAAAAVAVAHAPDPGQRAVFDARWLWRVARAHGLDWQPLSPHDRVVVERDSVRIGRDEVEALILAALAGQGVETGQARLHLANGGVEIALANDPAADLVVDAVQFDPRQHRFVASLVASGPGAAARRFRFAGRLDPVSDVPVPARRIAAGTVITAEDLAWQPVSARRLPRDTVAEPEHLIGMMARRPLAEGAPVRVADIGQPVEVSRGEAVTIVFTAPQMLLTARGRALEDGARGAVIRVANAQSRTVIDAVVTGPGQVAVDAATAARRSPTP